jgi:hypothetical protein
MNITQKYYIIFTICIFGIFFLLAAKINHVNKISDFPSRVKLCNTMPEILRFSCYRSTIEQYFGKDTITFGEWIHSHQNISFETAKKGGKVSYAVFGTNYHTFYHAAGDYIATYNRGKDILYVRNLGASTCTNGYIMGLYKRLALQQKFSLDYIKKLYTSCPEDEGYWCAHEVGHLLYDRNVYSILKVLDSISQKYYNVSYPQSYPYETFSNEDAEKSFAECDLIFSDTKRQSECYSGIGHNIFLFSEFMQKDSSSIEKECENISHKDSCHDYYMYRLGLNKVAPSFLSQKYNDGNTLCQKNAKGNSRLLTFCYKGLGRGMGLFFNSEYTNNVIENNKAQALKKIKEYKTLCSQSAKEFVSSCEKEFLDTKMIRRLLGVKRRV